MNMGDTFPLFAVPGRIRTVILQEFQGRCPTVQEVAQRSDKEWLAAPGVGLSALGIIRSVTVVQPVTEEASPSTSMSDDELLNRLMSIQEELRRIRDVLTAKMDATPSKGTRIRTRHRMRSYPVTTRELRI
ncbi:hypothetical protein AAII07_51800 [Microvirga sp. 0TCS3.31]